MQKRVVRIERTQMCDVLVHFPDSMDTSLLYAQDPETLIRGVSGIEWGDVYEDTYSIDHVGEATGEAVEDCVGEVTLSTQTGGPCHEVAITADAGELGP